MTQIIQCNCWRSLMIIATRKIMSCIFQTLFHCNQAN